MFKCALNLKHLEKSVFIVTLVQAAWFGCTKMAGGPWPNHVLYVKERGFLRLLDSSAGFPHPSSFSSPEPSPSNTSLSLISQDLVQPYPRLPQSDALRSVVSGHLMFNPSFDGQNQLSAGSDALKSEPVSKRYKNKNKCEVKKSFH